MYYIEIKELRYAYLVGPYTVGIITPSRKRHLIPMAMIYDPTMARNPANGSADDRLTPDEIAAYVLKHKLK